MEICETLPVKPVPKQSVLLINKKSNLGHDECCNCRCCSSSQPAYYKYVQPEVPKSFAPIRCYSKPDVPLDDNTTYKLSFWDGPRSTVQPFKPENSLAVNQGSFADETTHKLSYLGNWCVKPEEPIVPCSRQWTEGPIECDTTQKCDFTWKNIDPTKPIKARPNLYRPRAAMEKETTYRKSYYESACLKRVDPYKPVRRYVKSDVPMDGCTTYKLSYWANEIPMKETYPWTKPLKYEAPVTKMDTSTTYNLSYWPHCEKPPKPIISQDTDNLLNASCCFDDKTTYKLSYFDCEGDRRQLIRQSENINLSTCPFSHDTVNRLSYLGNWCYKPEGIIKPCSRSWLGQGRMQKETTQKCDFAWKYQVPGSSIVPQSNLKPSAAPLESCTTQKLSYMPADLSCLVPVKSFAPVRKYEKSAVPLETDTVQRLSYQSVEPAEKIEITWNKKGSYQHPTAAMEDNTTYNQSYILPGNLVPLCESEPYKIPEPKLEKIQKAPKITACSKPKPSSPVRTLLPQIKEPYFVPYSMSMPRPCITCGSS